MSRQRSQCVIKKRQEIKTDDEISNPFSQNHHNNNIVNSDNSDCNKLLIRQSLKNFSNLKLSSQKKPELKNFKKEFPSNSKQVLFLHEKAQFIGNFDRSMVKDIEPHNQIIDFNKFLLQFQTEEEIRNLELQDILDIDYEKLDEIKNKALEFIDATSLLMDENEKLGQNTESESELLLFFSQKLQELQSNEINLQIFVNNLEKVKGIGYSNNGMKIFFKNFEK